MSHERRESGRQSITADETTSLLRAAQPLHSSPDTRAADNISRPLSPHCIGNTATTTSATTTSAITGSSAPLLATPRTSSKTRTAYYDPTLIPDDEDGLDDSSPSTLRTAIMGSHCGVDPDGKISMSKTVAVVLGVLFIGVTVAVGLLVYNLAEPSGSSNSGGGGLLGTTVSPIPTDEPQQLLRDVRLPTHLVPRSYDVKLMPSVEPDWKIAGYVKIYMNCSSAGRNVTVHVLEITVDEATVRVEQAEDGQLVPIDKITYDTARQFMIVHLAQDLVPGTEYSLEITSFTAILNDQLAGFYRSKYEHKGEIRYMGVTQFQATDARRAFPCFDEPGLKAKFNVTLGRKSTDGWTTLSNMNAIATDIPIDGKPGYVWDKYAVSVDMSTYLVGFCVSQFGQKKATTNENFSVWARPDMVGRAQLAADEGAKILKFFESYFDIPFPLPKMDMLALTDFSAGAMENWGMITYREEYLLYDPTGQTTSASLLQRIIYIVAHELSHQWFGNLVTPKWWTDLWLNEGFASYVEYLGSQESKSKWQWMQMFIVSEVQDVMGVDSLASSHPIYQDVYNPDQIKELFDRISYGKGASIIRMMDNFLTKETFRKGLIEYLKAKSYSNAETEDLWGYLDKAAHEDGRLPDDLSVSQIMNTWTRITGYPVVTLTRHKNNTATLTQTRFLLHDSASSKSTDLWYVPINFNAQEKDFQRTNATHWLKPEGDLVLTEDDLAASSLTSWAPDGVSNWVVVNAQETGFYRVNYDAENWAVIQKQLMDDHTKIPTENRAQILDDAFNLARAGIIDFPTALGLTKYLALEEEYIPWRTTVNALSYIDKMLERSAGYGYFKDYMKCLTSGPKQLVPFQTLGEIDPNYDEDVTKLFKDVLIQGRACKYDVENCTTDATKLYKEWMENYSDANPDVSVISPNVKATVYCYGVANGGVAEWDQAYRHYTKSNLASEKTEMLAAMSCTEEVWLLSKYLELAFEKNSTVRSQDAARAFANIARSVIGRSLAFDFLINNFAYLKENFSAGISSMDSFINPFSTFNTASEAARMKAFKEEHEHELGSGTRAVDQAIESIEINTQWMAKYEDIVTEWFKDAIAGGCP